MLYIFGAVGAIIFFMVQLGLCFRSRKIAVRLIPVYVLLAGFLFSGLLFAGVFGTGGRYISIHELLGLVLGLFFAFSSLGEAAAWLTWGIRSAVKARR